MKDMFPPAEYFAHRPNYPEELFSYLATRVPPSAHVWDCACGSGQATIPLSYLFAKIDASDISEKQLRYAPKRDNVSYHVWPAEKTELKTGSVDLITVGQALHWFDLPLFIEEVKRVLKPEGILAVWCYQLCSINSTIDPLVRELYDKLPWKKERELVDSAYETLTLGERVEFSMKEEWDCSQFIGYLSTWSACRGNSILEEYIPLLESAWGNEKRVVTWPLHLYIRK